MDRLLAELAKLEKAYQPLLQSSEEKQLFEEVLGASRDYMNSHETLLQLSRRNDTDRAYALLRGEQYQRFETLSRNLAALIDLEQRKARESSRRATKSSTTPPAPSCWW